MDQDREEHNGVEGALRDHEDVTKALPRLGYHDRLQLGATTFDPASLISITFP